MMRLIVALSLGLMTSVAFAQTAGQGQQRELQEACAVVQQQRNSLSDSVAVAEARSNA